MGHRRAAAAVAPRQRRARGLPIAAQRRQWRRQPRRVAPPHRLGPRSACDRAGEEGELRRPPPRPLPCVRTAAPFALCTQAPHLPLPQESMRRDGGGAVVARLQVWPDEVTLTFGGAEARSRRRQGEAGGPGSPRPRPDPSHTHSSPPAPHILTCALAAHADQGACCSLCDGGGQGAVPHPHGGCWAAFCNRGAALSRKKLRVFACLRVVVSAWSDFKVEYVVETGQTPTSVAPL